MPEPPEAAEEVPAIVSMPAPLESPAPEGELPVETPVDFTEAVVEPDLQASSAVDGEELAVPTPEGAEDTPMFGPAPAIVSGETAAAPSPDAAEEVLAAPYAPSVASADVARPAIYDDTPMFSDAFTVFDEPAARPGSLALAPYVILGVVGIVLAGGGVFWGATTQSPYAWAASLVGIVFIAASVYYLLERLGGGSD